MTGCLPVSWAVPATSARSVSMCEESPTALQGRCEPTRLSKVPTHPAQSTSTASTQQQATAPAEELAGHQETQKKAIIPSLGEVSWGSAIYSHTRTLSKSSDRPVVAPKERRVFYLQSAMNVGSVCAH